MDHNEFAYILLGEKGVDRLSDVVAFTDDVDRSEQTVYQNVITLPKADIQEDTAANVPKEENRVKNEAMQSIPHQNEEPSLGF